MRCTSAPRLMVGAVVLATAAGCGSGSDDGGGGMAPDAMGVVAAGVRWFGRVDTANANLAQPRFSWSGSGFIARFSGTSLSMDLTVSGAATIFKTVVDGAPQPTFTAASGAGTYPLAMGLTTGVHTVEIYRQTEGAQGQTQLTALTTDGAMMDPPPGPGRLIEVIGDSISAGYGNLGVLADTECFTTESHWDTYGAVTARALGAEVSTIAASGRGVIRNYGGDTMGTLPLIYGLTLTNLSNPPWDFHIEPQAVIINLGTNDISNNKGDPGMEFRDTYLAFLETIRGKYPHAFIMGIIGPLTNASEVAILTGHIKSAVDARVAAGDKNVEMFDMILPQTPDKFACQYHPNVAENQLMADQITAELRTKLGW